MILAVVLHCSLPQWRTHGPCCSYTVVQRGGIDPCSRSRLQNVLFCLVFSALFAFPVFECAEWSVKLIGRWQGKCNYVLIQQEYDEEPTVLWRKKGLKYLVSNICPNEKHHRSNGKQMSFFNYNSTLFHWFVWAFLNPAEAVSHSAWLFLSLCLFLQSYSLFC